MRAKVLKCNMRTVGSNIGKLKRLNGRNVAGFEIFFNISGPRVDYQSHWLSDALPVWPKRDRRSDGARGCVRLDLLTSPMMRAWSHESIISMTMHDQTSWAQPCTSIPAYYIDPRLPLIHCRFAAVKRPLRARLSTPIDPIDPLQICTLLVTCSTRVSYVAYQSTWHRVQAGVCVRGGLFVLHSAQNQRGTPTRRLVWSDWSPATKLAGCTLIWWFLS